MGRLFQDRKVDPGWEGCSRMGRLFQDGKVVPG